MPQCRHCQSKNLTRTQDHLQVAVAGRAAAVDLLADLVAACVEYHDLTGSVSNYLVPAGPVYRAIAFLEQHISPGNRNGR